MELVFSQQDETGIRLDRYLARELPECSRSRLQALIRDGHILLNGAVTRPRQALSPGDTIDIELPEPEPASLRPEAIPLAILFEDEDLLVIDKPAGLVVHPGAGNAGGTLVNALLHRCPGLPEIGDRLRPGIVHRLDKDTSGCIVVARTDRAHERLSEAFAQRRVAKRYLALLERSPRAAEGRIESRIGRHPVNRLKMAEVEAPAGREALTEYRVLSTAASGAALIECVLHTGRTHQIRVHMKSLGAPILGDEIYARPERQPIAVPRLMLHAWKLGFFHPCTGEPMTFEAPIPEAFAPYLPNNLKPPISK